MNTMNKLELKYKAQVVDRILGCHAEFRESFGFHCYKLDDLQNNYPVEKVSFVIHQLFHDIMIHKSDWFVYPHELSCVNFVLKHLRFMLCNKTPSECCQYARENLFYPETKS